MNGHKLRVIREFRNYSQEHIAARLGISQNAYSRIENNQTKITADRLQQLAGILGVPTEELLSEKDPVIHFSFSKVQLASQVQAAPSPQSQSAAPAVTVKEEQWQELIESTRQLYRQVIYSKDEKIAFLENEISALREERKKIIQVIERLTS